MKKLLYFSLLFLQAQPSSAQQKFSTSHCFIANKGQLRDKQNHPRKDIDFVYQNDGLKLCIGKGKLEYSFPNSTAAPVVMELQDINTSAITPFAEGGGGYKEHYYMNDAVIESAMGATRLCYKNIYPGIDWILYLNNGTPEHEFVVSKNADPKKIKWQYSGATATINDKTGDLNIKTTAGIITEKRPESFTTSGAALSTAYTRSSHAFSYTIKGNTAESFTIDPTVEWGTYLRGDELSLFVTNAVSDKKGHLYITGYTNCGKGLASPSGVHQSTLSGLGDAFVSKFDTAGRHIWTTYYGGPGEAFLGSGDAFYDIATGANSLYLVGSTTSTTGISSGGTEQDNYCPGAVGDGMVVKLDTSGKRIWGRYYGGFGSDYLSNIALDASENMYITGITWSRNVIASPGSQKDTLGGGGYSDTTQSDAFLIKLTKDGKRIWGTYVGGRYDEEGSSVAVYDNDVYVSGTSNSLECIATAGAYQTALKSTASLKRDNFLCRYDTSGKKIWGTYYGGAEDEYLSKIACNKRGMIYLYSSTNSTTDIASPGAFQTTVKGFYDAYLVKFDSTGKTRLWGTYLGGTDNDFSIISYGGRIVCDDAGDDNNVHIFGSTRSSGLATLDASQDTLFEKTKYDAFLASVNGSGEPYYFTYFGGEGDDNGVSAIYDGKSVYLAGNTASFNNIATPGSFKTTYKGYAAGFLAKFGQKSKPSAIDEKTTVHKTSLIVYPNPAAGKVHIDASFDNAENGVASIDLYNMLGKKVQSEACTIVNSKLAHDFHFYQSLQPGVYQLSVTHNNNCQSLQLIKTAD